MAEAVIVPEDELLDRTGLALRPLPGGFGVELAGLDLRQKQDPQIGALLPRLWRRYGLLLIRRQDLGPAEVAAFGATFGEPRRAPIMDSGRVFVEGHPEVFAISNLVDNKSRVGALGTGALDWHAVMSYLSAPPRAVCLYAYNVSRRAGRTGFLDACRAYDALPQPLRAAVTELTIKHDAAYTLDGYLREGCGLTLARAKARGGFDIRMLVGASHPAVRTDAETGMRSLFLGRRQNAYAEGLAVAESEALLDALWRFVARFGEAAYHHPWENGDLIVWDNHRAMLRREAFLGSLPRTLLRVQMHGPETIPAETSGR